MAGQLPVFAQNDSLDREPKISLSAATIIDLLRREPGLLLEVKRELVRKAYEQGRVLDPADLTDEALFRLLREDDNVRVLATEEIERRGYVHAKPTPREIENGKVERLPDRVAGKDLSSGKEASASSAEERYWAEHEELAPQMKAAPQDDPRTEDGFSDDGFVEPKRAEPPIGPKPWQPLPSPEYRVSPDSRRWQSLTGIETPGADSYHGTQSVPGSLPRTDPDGTSGLLSARMDESSTPAQRRGSADGFSPPVYSFPALSPDDSGTSQILSSTANPRTSLFENRAPWLPPTEDDRPLIRRRANPYAEVPSLYDLYAQVSRHSPALTRFGEAVFSNGTGNFDELPMDVPVGPDYVLGPGDGLSINLWGGISQRLQRVVDHEGRVALPEAAAIQVTGRSLGDVQQLIQAALRGEFRDVHADVALARLRTVRVYVVGDVLRPGAYDVSSLSTPLNALYQAGGPTARGSLRIVRLYRRQRLVGEVDLYDLLLHGIGSKPERLEAGDTVMIPPAGAELTVEGMVRRPAIYELNHEGNLAEALQLAGGVLNTGTLRHIEVERVVAHESRVMLRLDLPENDVAENDPAENDLPSDDLPSNVLLKNSNRQTVSSALEDFKIQDGDKIRISPILAYSDRTVFLDGHVFHPGKYAFREGMRITDLVHSYSDLLPEPSSQHAEIIRLAAPDYAPQVIAFNLADALADNGSNQQNAMLKAFDTVRIFGRFDFEDPPTITVSGEVRHPGRHITNGETRLRAAVYLAGGVTQDALLDDAQIFRHTPDGKLKVLSVSLKGALAGDAADNLQLEPGIVYSSTATCRKLTRPP